MVPVASPHRALSLKSAIITDCVPSPPMTWGMNAKINRDPFLLVTIASPKVQWSWVVVGRAYVSCAVYPMKYDRGLVVLRRVVFIPPLYNGFTWSIYPYSPALLTGMGLLPGTKNRGLHLRRECRERFPRHRLQRKPVVSNPGMHHGIMHDGIGNLRWRRKRSRHSRCMRNLQFYVSIKRPMG